MGRLKPGEVFANDYVLVKLLGRGGYGDVWLAKYELAGDLEVALKVYAPEKGLDSDGQKIFMREYKLVFNLSHQHLLTARHFGIFEDSPYLIMSYCKNGTALQKTGLISENELYRFMYQSAQALEYLHRQKECIIHQDVKPDNFLIDNEDNYRLADFGISDSLKKKLTQSMGQSEESLKGVLPYSPPEKFSNNKKPLKAGDIFSLGVTMYELFSGELPFGELGGLYYKSDSEVPDLPQEKMQYSKLNDIFKLCMSKNLEDRPTAADLVDVAFNFLYPQKRNSNTIDIEIQSWQTALDLNTMEGYEFYLKNFENQNGRHTNDARLKIKILLEIQKETKIWEDSRMQDTIETYEQYLLKYPLGQFIIEAKARIEYLHKDNFSWKKACKADNVDAYMNYKNEFTLGKHIQQAEDRIKNLQADESAWKKAMQNGSIALFLDYQKMFPDGKHVHEVEPEIFKIKKQFQEKAEDLWNQILNSAKNNKKIKLCRRYLADFKNEPRVDDIRQLYDHLKSLGNKKLLWYAISTFIILLMISLLIYYYGPFERNIWRRTEHTKEGLITFLKSYPNGEHSPEAKSILSGIFYDELVDKYNKKIAAGMSHEKAAEKLISVLYDSEYDPSAEDSIVSGCESFIAAKRDYLSAFFINLIADSIENSLPFTLRIKKIETTDSKDKFDALLSDISLWYCKFNNDRNQVKSNWNTVQLYDRRMDILSDGNKIKCK